MGLVVVCRSLCSGRSWVAVGAGCRSLMLLVPFRGGAGGRSSPVAGAGGGGWWWPLVADVDACASVVVPFVDVGDGGRRHHQTARCHVITSCQPCRGSFGW